MIFKKSFQIKAYLKSPSGGRLQKNGFDIPLPDFFKGIERFREIVGDCCSKGYVLYIMAMSNIRSKKRGSSILLCTEDWKRAKLELDIFTNDSGIRPSQLLMIWIWKRIISWDVPLPIQSDIRQLQTIRHWGLHLEMKSWNNNLLMGTYLDSGRFMTSGYLPEAQQVRHARHT